MKLKQMTSLLLVFLLLVSNTGFAFNVHFCGGSVASISLKSEAANDKGCCGMKAETSNCCKSKVVHFQKKSDNTLVKAFAFQSPAIVALHDWQPIVFAPTAQFKGDSNTTYYCDAHAPPLYQLHSQYIFYDKV